MTARILQGDARAMLPGLAAGSVHMAVTSPPYWAQRKYAGETCSCVRSRIKDASSTLNSTSAEGTPNHSRADPDCPKCLGTGQGAQIAAMIGNEPTPQAWCDNLVAVFRAVKRVLRDDGVLFVNCGDKYAGSGGAGGDYAEGGLKASATGTGPLRSRATRPSGLLTGGTRTVDEGLQSVAVIGYRPKSLIGLPWMLAFALMRDGWILRQEIIWHKRSPMPESATDRPTRAHEQLFMFSKEPHYYWDAEAVREKQDEPGKVQHHGASRKEEAGRVDTGNIHTNTESLYNPAGRSARSVQAFAPSPFSVKRLGKYGPMPEVDHYALFPISLPLWCIRAATSEKGVCPECGAPWVRQLQKSNNYAQRKAAGVQSDHRNQVQHPERMVTTLGPLEQESVTVGWAASCAHADQTPVPATVLDCFMGAGTTALAAEQLGRNSAGCEIAPDYIRLAEARLYDAAPLLGAR